MIHAKISYFSFYGAVPRDSNLWWCITTDRYKDKVEAIRAIDDATIRARKKKQLPGFTPSGLFSERRAKGLIKHSGYICLDMDGKDNDQVSDWQEFIHELGEKYSFIAYAGLSVSGKGAYAIVPIMDANRHTQHFDALVEELAPVVAVDRSGRDVSRYRFVSYNADPYVNSDADIYGKYIEPQKAIRRTYAGTDKGVQMLYDEIMQDGTNITSDYHDWFALACALRDVPNGRQMFHDLSTMDARYSHEQCDRQYNDALKGSGYTIATFFDICRKNGITYKNRFTNN